MNKKPVLIIGDILTMAILTTIGFIMHGEADISFIPRMAASFFPVLFAWFVLAPWFGLFDEQITSTSKLLWRIPLVFLFAAPLAAILRSALLGSPAIPQFVTILGGSNALGMLVWRWTYGFIAKRSPK